MILMEPEWSCIFFGSQRILSGSTATQISFDARDSGSPGLWTPPDCSPQFKRHWLYKSRPETVMHTWALIFEESPGIRAATKCLHASEVVFDGCHMEHLCGIYFWGTQCLSVSFYQMNGRMKGTRSLDIRLHGLPMTFNEIPWIFFPPLLCFLAVLLCSHRAAVKAASMLFPGRWGGQFTPLNPRGSDLHSSALKENIYSPLIAVFVFFSPSCTAPLVYPHAPLSSPPLASATVSVHRRELVRKLYIPCLLMLWSCCF